MNLPGFNAEASLGRAASSFRSAASTGEIPSVRSTVIPSLPNTGGGGTCGACTETRWPNGSGTGACVQDCTDVLGRHTFRSCSCPSSGGGLGGFGAHWGNVFVRGPRSAVLR